MIPSCTLVCVFHVGNLLHATWYIYQICMHYSVDSMKWVHLFAFRARMQHQNASRSLTTFCSQLYDMKIFPFCSRECVRACVCVWLRARRAVLPTSPAAWNYDFQQHANRIKLLMDCNIGEESSSVDALAKRALFQRPKDIWEIGIRCKWGKDNWVFLEIIQICVNRRRCFGSRLVVWGCTHTKTLGIYDNLFVA